MTSLEFNSRERLNSLNSLVLLKKNKQQYFARLTILMNASSGHHNTN